ncbi:ABC transporter substrate-binding protein [Nocardioides terrisoli]|uniref:ABC transporter substrate-binding protein n=1 Tax=Nocardioides terrisoli TaxID=3388267 RepID=UPI00287B8C10|nr:ABC transporter substrate-binding protein [Nocardioides marmorisolisilvae]
MRVRNLTAAVAVTGMLLATTACGGGASSSGEVTVGAVLTLTGVGADFGQAQRAALEMGVADEEKKTGTKVNLVVEDSGESNTVALSALSSVLSKRPAIVYGPFLGTQVLAMTPKVEQAKVPLLVTSGTKSITEGAATSQIFRWYASTALSEPATAAYLDAKLHIKAAAILYDTTAYGQDGLGLVRGQLEKDGVKVLTTQAVNPTDTDVSGQVHSILATKPDAIFVQLIGGASGAVALKALTAQGNHAPVIWGSGITSHSLLDLIDDQDVNGVYGNQLKVITAQTAKGEIGDFLQRYKKKTNREGDAFALAAYDAGRFIVQSVADGVDTPQKWDEHLKSTTYKGLLATYHDDGDGNMVNETTILQMHNKVPVPIDVVNGAPAK